MSREIHGAGFKDLSLRSRDPILYKKYSPVTSNTTAVSDLLAIENRPPSPVTSPSIELVSFDPTSSSQAARRPKHRTTQQTKRAYSFGLAMLRLVSTEHESILLEESGNERRLPARRTLYDIRMAQWLLSRGLSWKFSCIYGNWKQSLRTFRYISDGSMIVHFCRNGDVASVQRMFENGLASPFDRVRYKDEDWSLLHVSITSYHHRSGH